MNRLFILSDNTLQLLGNQLNFNGTFNHTARSAYGQNAIGFRLKIERGETQTEATVEMGGEKHSITLHNGDGRNPALLADLIDAIANGRVDTAEIAPPLAMREAEPVEPLLSTEQEQQLRLLVRKGGTLDLHMGFEHPIRVAVHRTFNKPGITAILSIGERKPRTLCWTSYEREARIYTRLAESVEQLASAATPAAANAAAA